VTSAAPARTTRPRARRDGICVVADGMGGHAAGEIAGRLATEALGETLAGRDLVWRGSPWPPR
jgi:serine/threonine protein phosphatase PrpC